MFALFIWQDIALSWALMPNAASQLLHQDITLTCGHPVTKDIPYSSFSQRIMSAADGRGESNTDLLFKPQSLEYQVMKQVKAFNYLRTKICCSLSFSQTADTVWKKSQHGQYGDLKLQVVYRAPFSAQSCCSHFSSTPHSTGWAAE